MATQLLGGTYTIEEPGKMVDRKVAMTTDAMIVTATYDDGTILEASLKNGQVTINCNRTLMLDPLTRVLRVVPGS